MGKSRKKSNRPVARPDPPDVRLPGKMPESADRFGRFWTSSILRTVGSTILILFLVAIYHIVKTSGREAKTYKLERWIIDNQSIEVPEEGITVGIEKNRKFILHPMVTGHPNYSLFSFEIIFNQRFTGNIYLCYRDEPLGNAPFTYHDITNFIGDGSKSWVRIEGSFDDIPDLHTAKLIGFYITTPNPPIFLKLRNSELHSLSLFGRAQQLLSALLVYRPLTQSHNNFIISPTVAGRGYLYLFWISLIWATILLLIRRTVFRESFRLERHCLLSVFILFVLADLRNHRDYVGYVKDARTRWANSNSLDEFLGRSERLYPWFLDVLTYLKSIPPGESFYIQSMDPGNEASNAAISRLCYYAMPKTHVRNVNDADVALVFYSNSKTFRSGDWQYTKTLSNTIQVFERGR